MPGIIETVGPKPKLTPAFPVMAKDLEKLYSKPTPAPMDIYETRGTPNKPPCKQTFLGVTK